MELEPVHPRHDAERHSNQLDHLHYWPGHVDQTLGDRNVVSGDGGGMVAAVVNAVYLAADYGDDDDGRDRQGLF